MSKRKINVLVDEGFSDEYLKFLNKSFDIVKVYTFNNLLEGKSIGEIDLVVLTGGADVDPSIYGESIGKYTSISMERDKKARQVLGLLSYKIPKLGICRGSQLLTAVSGGKVIQHVENHTSSHDMIVNLGGIGNKIRIKTTSTHHQMMYPFNLNKDKFELIAYSKFFRSNTYLNGNNAEIDKPFNFLEPEIVYYNNTNSLAIQGHPEFSSADETFKKLSLDLIDKYLFKK